MGTINYFADYYGDYFCCSSFGRSRFWLVLVISIAILAVEYLGYDFWRRSRVEKNYSELLQIQEKIEKTKETLILNILT